MTMFMIGRVFFFLIVCFTKFSIEDGSLLFWVDFFEILQLDGRRATQGGFSEGVHCEG